MISLFPILMVVGLIGLALMAVAGFGRHGHAGAAPHGLGHAGHGALQAGHGAGHAPGGHHAVAGAAPGRGSLGLFGLLPSPRVIFSLLTLYGASGYALVETGYFTPLLAGLLAIVPTVLMERLAVQPLWRLLTRFQGTPSAPLHDLVLNEARAVTPFRNGRGLVSVDHDGRVVQFRAQLVARQEAMPVRVGDTLLIDEVDAPNERVTVSLR